MAGVTKARVEGLYTSPNSLSAQPPGALQQADDIVVTDQFVGEGRPGFATRTAGFGSASSRADAIAAHRSADILAAYDSGKLAYSVDDGASFHDYPGSYAPVDPTLCRVRVIGADDQSYVATAAGLKVVSSSTSTTPAAAGVPAALFASHDLAEASGWLAYDRAVAYRYTLVVYRDGKAVESRPSGRYTVTTKLLCKAGSIVRTGGATVTVTTQVPHGFLPGSTFTLTTAEANFANGLKTVSAWVDPNTFTYNEAGANASSTVDHECQPVSGPSRAPQVSMLLPPGTVAGTHYLRLYRSIAAPSAATVPSDEIYQVGEYPIAGVDIVLGYVTANDTAPESLLGSPLYSNPNTGGEEPNERPPLARDIAWWESRLWYANTQSRHRLFVDLIGVGSPSGLQAGDTITVDGTVYTAQATPPLAGDRHFQVFTGGTPSENITNTAKAFLTAVWAYNQYVIAAPNTSAGYYISSDSDLPGKLMFEEVGIGGAGFTFTASRPSAWSPTSTVTSSNDRNQHWLFYSKEGEPESVPLVNYLPVGSKNSPIQRIFPFRDRLYVFKREGIFVVSGADPFQVTQISNARLLASESVCVLNDAVWCLTDSGVGFVTDSGVTVVSRPIEKDLRTAFNDGALATQQLVTFAVPVEGKHLYCLWCSDGTVSSYANQVYVFSIATSTWVRWTKPGRAGLQNPSTGALWLARGDANSISAMRNASSASRNLADEEWTITVSAITGKTLTPSSMAAIKLGDLITDGSTQFAWVAAVGASSLTLTDALGVSPGASLTVYPAIRSVLRFSAIDAGDPGLQKTGRDLQLLWGAPHGFRNASLDYDTDVQSADTSIALTGTDSGFGWNSYGDSPWGGVLTSRTRVSPLGTEASQFGSLNVALTVQQAWAPWRLLGIRVELEMGSERSRR
jgi:hypothetical protein